jgi:hypothetical protein
MAFPLSHFMTTCLIFVASDWLAHLLSVLGQNGYFLNRSCSEASTQIAGIADGRAHVQSLLTVLVVGV